MQREASERVAVLDPKLYMRAFSEPILDGTMQRKGFNVQHWRTVLACPSWNRCAGPCMGL